MRLWNLYYRPANGYVTIPMELEGENVKYMIISIHDIEKDYPDINIYSHLKEYNFQDKNIIDDSDLQMKVIKAIFIKDIEDSR